MAKKPIIRYFDRGVWYDATVSDIGNLEDLNTVHKTTVVEAINDIIGGNINISGELLEKLTALDNNISRIDGLIASGSLNETQANQMNQFVTNKLNELNQSMEEMNKQRDQRLKEQEEKVAQLKLDSESDKQRIEEITLDLNATKEKLNNAELNVTSVTQLVDEINGKISQAVSKTDFDLLEGTVREQKTLIDQTVEGIKLLATKEELDKSNENVKSIKSALEVQAGLIESKVSSEQLINEIEKIDKYMPNLLRYTRNWQDWENDDEANIDVTLNEYRDCIIQRARGIGKGLSTTVEDLVIGETYSLSVWVKHDDINAKLYAMVDNVEIIMTDLNSEETFVSNEFKRMRCSFVAQGTTAKVRFIFKDCRTDSYGYLAGAKCEKNKKVSGWQPHSEDVYQSIKSARSEIKQTDGKITTLVETVNKQGDLITSHTTSIEETDKAIKLQAESIKTLDESIESAKAELKVNSDAISSKVWKTDVGEMISDINIDNKNRVLNSDFGDGWELWSETNNLFQLKQIGNYKFAVAERSGLPQNMAIAIATNKFPVKHNERLMFGFYFYCADLSKLDNKIVCALELLDINDIRIDRVDFDVSKLSLENGSFTKLTDTYFVEDERIVKARLRFFLNRNGNVGFALPMAQGGDIKSSDWSLAPEDVARRFNDTNVTITNYEQTVGGFRQTVESYKGSVDGYTNQVSEFNQTVNGFSQTIKDYKESNDKRVQQLETSLTTESGKIEAVVKESAGTKDELGKLTADGGRISQLELTAQGFSTTVGEITKSVTKTNERIDNINIGGRNLFVDAGFKKEVRTGSSYETGYWFSYVDSKFNYPKYDDDCNYLYFTASNDNSKGIMQFFDTNKLIKGQTYSVRTQVKVDAKITFRYQLAKKNPDNSYNWYFKYYDTTVTSIGEWVDVKWTFTIPKDDDAMRYGVAIRNLQTGTNVAIRIMKPKLEVGNMFTDFSFAPEDQQSQIDNINNNLREQYMTIEQSNSWIEQKKDSIVQGVSQSVETLGNRLDNLKLSDDNLLEKTDTSVFGKGNWFSNGDGNISLDNNTLYQGRPTLKVDFTQNNSGAKNNQYITLKPDTEYYYSIVVKSNKSFSMGNSIPLHIWMHNTTATGNHVEISLEYGPKTVNANEWTTIVRKFKTPKDYDTYYLYVLIYGLSGLVINVADIQVREGSKYIPWSPSSKDQQSQINGINNNLTNNYYQKTTVDSKLSTAVGGITAQYTQDINTKLGNYYDKSTIDSKLTIDGQGITTYVKNTQSQLDNMTGFRNLWKHTKDYDGSKYDKWGQIHGEGKIGYKNWKPYTTIDGFGVQYINHEWDDLSQCVPIKHGGTYTLSAMVKLGSSTSSVGVYINGATIQQILVNGVKQTTIKNVIDNLSATEYKRVSVTYKNTGNMDYSFIRFEPTTNSTMYMYQPMFNEGYPLPWEPNKEDMITLKQYTEVKQLADRISSTVYDSSTGLTTKVNQLAGKYAITALNSAGDILASLNLNANTSTAEINAKLIRLNGSTKMDDAFVNKLVANSILTNKIKATEISGNYIKGGKITGVSVETNSNGATATLNNGRLSLSKTESVNSSTKRYRYGFVEPNYVLMNTYEGNSESNRKLTASTWFDANGFYNNTKDSGGVLRKRSILFNSEGIAISPENIYSSNVVNEGDSRNTGIRLHGRRAYLDLNGNRTGVQNGTISRIISEPNGNMEIINYVGTIHLNTKNGENPVSNGYKIPYTFADGNMGIRVARIANPTSSGPYLELVNMVGNAWGVSMWASDQRLKTNIQSPTQDALDTLNQLQVRQFDWKSDNVHEDFGLIAQEVEQVLPNAVLKVGDYYQIKDSGLIPVLIGAVQKLSNKVNLLENIIYNTKGGNLL